MVIPLVHLACATCADDFVTKEDRWYIMDTEKNMDIYLDIGIYWICIKLYKPSTCVALTGFREHSYVISITMYSHHDSCSKNSRGLQMSPHIEGETPFSDLPKIAIKIAANQPFPKKPCLSVSAYFCSKVPHVGSHT